VLAGGPVALSFEHLLPRARYRGDVGCRVTGPLGVGAKAFMSGPARSPVLKPEVLGWIFRRARQWRPDGVLAADLVQRNLDPSGPDQLWAPEMTRSAPQGWLYLAAVLDLCSFEPRPRCGEECLEQGTDRLVNSARCHTAFC